jgi:hypothetical protein
MTLKDIGKRNNECLKWNLRKKLVELAH